MYLRYSFSVVAPMARSSPRASAGFSMLLASMAPSAAPAPTTVCSSSMNRMMAPALSSISLSTAFSRSSNSLRETFDDGRLAHAGLADEHGIVLGAPRENLDRAADLLVAANDRVELAAP